MRSLKFISVVLVALSLGCATARPSMSHSLQRIKKRHHTHVKAHPRMTNAEKREALRDEDALDVVIRHLNNVEDWKDLER